MEVPVIKIKESCPGKSDEKLIKSIMNMVGQAPHCMWHASRPFKGYLTLGLNQDGVTVHTDLEVVEVAYFRITLF